MVINQEGKILLCEGYFRGWEFPGGFVNRGETIKAAAIREVKEESGIDIQITQFLGVEHHLEKSTIVFVLKGKTVGGELASSNENKAVGYFSFEQALSAFKLKNFKERLIRCSDDEVIPFFIEV